MRSPQPNEPDLDRWLERVPKVELHLHLEGAIPLAALWQLVQKHGGDREVDSLAALERRFRYRDFDHFLEAWSWKNRYLRSYDDFRFIAEEVARDLARQRVLHAEIFFSPSDFAVQGLEPARLAQEIRAGLDRVPAISVLLVADLVRDDGPEGAGRTLDALAGAREHGVVGVGIGGSEHRFPPAPFARVYDRARALGFHTSAHAGEAAGAASVWSAIDDLAVERVGHGVAAREDPRLIAALAERRVHVEVCPISNLCTGVVRAIAEHPVRELARAGVPFSINSDDPKMFDTSLAAEYRALHRELGFGAGDIRRAIRRAALDSWLPAARKQELVAALEADPDWGEA